MKKGFHIRFVNKKQRNKQTSKQKRYWKLDDWYIEWQQVTTSGTTIVNESQQLKTNCNDR